MIHLTFTIIYGVVMPPIWIPSPSPRCAPAPHRSAAAQRPSAASRSVVSSQPPQRCGFRSTADAVARARPSTDNLRRSLGKNMEELGKTMEFLLWEIHGSMGMTLQ